jgi:hypothetical protein
MVLTDIVIGAPGSNFFEVLMLICFACSWPISIIRALRTKIVIGKSPVFMMIIIAGYGFGIVHKVINDYDYVTYLYVFNLFLVALDLFLYFYYIKKNRTEILKK